MKKLYVDIHLRHAIKQIRLEEEAMRPGRTEGKTTLSIEQVVSAG